VGIAHRGPSGHSPPARQTGVTLVETLVTLVSTSVGLLGIAALHLLTTANYQEASERLRATALATAMLEQIRANDDAFRRHLYDVDFNGAADRSTGAGQQIDRWRASVSETLSPARGLVTKTAIISDPGASRITIIVRWSRFHQPTNQNAPFRQVTLESAI